MYVPFDDIFARVVASSNSDTWQLKVYEEEGFPGCCVQLEPLLIPGQVKNSEEAWSKDLKSCSN